MNKRIVTFGVLTTAALVLGNMTGLAQETAPPAAPPVAAPAAAPAATPPAAAPAATPAPAAAAPMVVKVKLNEWTMGLGAMKVKGPVQFEVVNEGQFPHALTIEGEIGGKPFEITTGRLLKGEKTTLIVNLPPGVYNTICPVGNHATRGMMDPLTFE